MDAILATSANDVLYQKITYADQDKPTENKIPWHSSHPIDLEFFKSFTAGKILWCSVSTYLSLPFSMRVDPNRAFKVMGRVHSGFTLTGWFTPSQRLAPSHMPIYSFQDLKNNINNLGDQHVLIGGLKAYQEFLPSCKNVIWGKPKVHYHHPGNVYFPNHLMAKYSPFVYQSIDYDLIVFSRTLTNVHRVKRNLGLM